MKAEGHLAIFPAQTVEANRLPVIRAIPPRESRFQDRFAAHHRHPGIADIVLAGDDAEVLLRQAAVAAILVPAPKRQAMLARKSAGRVQVSVKLRTGRADHLPGGLVEWLEELAVEEFLGPDPIMDAASQVFEELVVKIG